VAPQYDHDRESHHAVAQLRVSEDMIRAATRCTNGMHGVMEDYCWRASVTHGSSNEEISMEDFHSLRERVSVMRIDHQQLLTRQDYSLRISDTYDEALREQELEMDRLTQELGSTQGYLRVT
jgi:hypothetical protein